ncbi:uncharacterized protein LOC128236056 [Mya arenaria]|uniref:uncharacterized protein LOC128236056 n=1 Tax=Mya arenaria TaxID=6604 RepID=UPI0022E3CCAC|nr:uncharacterized protein LOC128236056 [Mya arenaria]
MNRESKLPRQLQEWTTQEIHFNLQSSHSAVLYPEMLKVLCKGQGAAIWQWVAQHVKSTEKGLETEEYYSREAAGGDSEGEETEGKTPAMETASMERRRSIIVKRQQVENLTERKKLSEIRLLEISFMVQV